MVRHRNLKRSTTTSEHPLIHVTDLQPGDELICYMRLGLALELAAKGDGTPYRRVPRRPQKARSDALTRFTGIVLQNNTAAGVLTLATTRLDSQKIAVNDRVLTADVHYSAFKRVQLLSKTHTEPSNTYGGRPTKYEGRGTARKAFRTLEEVSLT